MTQRIIVAITLCIVVVVLPIAWTADLVGEREFTSAIFSPTAASWVQVIVAAVGIGGIWWSVDQQHKSARKVQMEEVRARCFVIAELLHHAIELARSVMAALAQIQQKSGTQHLHPLIYFECVRTDMENLGVNDIPLRRQYSAFYGAKLSFLDFFEVADRLHRGLITNPEDAKEHLNKLERRFYHLTDVKSTFEKRIVEMSLDKALPEYIRERAA